MGEYLVQLGDLTVEVRDINYRRMGLIDLRHARMTLMPAFRNIGSWELELPRDHSAVKHLRQPGSGIVVTGPGGVFLTGRMITADSTASADVPEGMVSFSGVTDEIVLQDRLAWPVPTSGTMEGQAAAERDSRTGPAETVMHGFVNANAGPGAVPERRTPRLTMGTNLGRGEVDTWTSRFANLLDVVREVAEDSNMGFRVVQVGEGIQFECFEPRDMRREIRFDLWNNTLTSYSVEEAGATLTHAIVGGRGEGTERLFIQQTSDEALEQVDEWGRRIEEFLDWRATEDESELIAAANRSLRVQGGSQNRVQFVPTDEHTMRFLLDWNLGDQVTAVVEGREISAWVSQAVVRVDTEGVRVGAILGNVSDTPEQMRDIETRINRLERELEVGDGDNITAQRLHLTSTSDASGTSTMHALEIGALAQNAGRLLIDNNEIQTLNGANPSTLHINEDGGNINMLGGGTLNLSGPLSSSNLITAHRIRLTSTSDASTTSTMHGLEIGSPTGGRILIDDNEIMAAIGANTANLFLNPDGGDVLINNSNSPGQGQVLANQDSVVTRRNLQRFTVPIGISFAAGWGQSTYNTFAAVSGNMIQVRLSFQRTGAPITSGVNGDIANSDIGVITNVNLRPAFQTTAGPAHEGPMRQFAINSNGNVTITAFLPNQTIATGSSVVVHATYIANNRLSG